MPSVKNFWSSPEAMDPKRNHRFILLANSIPVYTLKKVAKPSWSAEPVSHLYMGHEYKYPGLVKWETVSMTLVNIIDPDMAATVMNIIKNAGYHPLADVNDFASLSKRRSQQALGQTQIMTIGEDGKPVEIWSLQNAWVSKVSFSEGDYSNADMQEIEIEITFDWAELTIGSGQTIYGTGATDNAGFQGGLTPNENNSFLKVP